MLRLLVFCSSCCVVACAERPPQRRDLPERAVFIALERDFEGFEHWGSVRIAEAKAAGETHPAGEHRVYVNALPAEGSTSFPVGTMMVKRASAKVGIATSDAGAAEREQYFAMVKRGGGFNAQGARGWEWFELKARADGTVGIAWRGLGAPTGESYGGDALGSCNSCHEMDVANDYVKSAALKLERPLRAAR